VGLAVILGGVAVKLLLADVWEFPVWSAPAFIIAVLAVVGAASVCDSRRARLRAPRVEDLPAGEMPCSSQRTTSGGPSRTDRAGTARPQADARSGGPDPG
jgi:hypothetical protein